MLRSFGALASLVVVLVLPASAADEPEPATDSSLDEAVAACVQAAEPAERLERGLALAAAKPSADAVAAALAKAWTWDKGVELEEIDWELASRDGVEHTIFAYVPQAYTPDKAWPVLVWLHGGVARDQDGGGANGIRMFMEEAEEKGFLVLSPSTQNGAHWWTPNGAKLLRDALRDLASTYRVDPDRIAVAGGSDGGSGCFHLLAHDPTPYAVFLSVVGNPLVTRIYGGPSWSTNLASRPVWALNGGQDRLYPSARMEPFIDALKEAGCDLTWVDVPEAGHDFSPLADRWDDVHAFWQEHPRDALPKKVAWASSAPRHDGRHAWLEIRALDAAAPAAEGLEAPEAMERPDMTPRPRLGIVLDQAFPGPGLRIQEVQEGTPASEAGFEAGDVILRVNDVTFASFAEVMKLREVLDGLDDEDGLFLVVRGDEELEIKARPKVLGQDRVATPEGLGYGVEPGVVAAVIEGDNVIDLRTRGVRHVRLHLREPLVDLGKDVVVRVNGKERFRGSATKDDVAYLLAQAFEVLPGEASARAYVDVEIDA